MGTDGGEVELLADEDRPGGWLLLLDRVRQSYVSLDDPTYLEFPYVQTLAGIVDALPPGPLDVVHVGGGGATLPRWISEIRPGSVQTVFETHAELLRVVQTRLPVPATAGIEIRLVDGRSGVAGLDSDCADAVVIDAFSGGRVPARLSTAEFFHDIARVLRPAGVLLLNTTGAAPSLYLRRLVAAMVPAFSEVLVFGGDRGSVGNLVVAAGAADRLPVEVVLGQDGPMGPPLALSGRSLVAFVDGAEPLTDASSLRSPIPPDDTWRVGSE